MPPKNPASFEQIFSCKSDACAGNIYAPASAVTSFHAPQGVLFRFYKPEELDKTLYQVCGATWSLSNLHQNVRSSEEAVKKEAGRGEACRKNKQLLQICSLLDNKAYKFDFLFLQEVDVLLGDTSVKRKWIKSFQQRGWDIVLTQPEDRVVPLAILYKKTALKPTGTTHADFSFLDGSRNAAFFL